MSNLSRRVRWRCAITIAALCITGFAQAGDASLSWEAPTLNTDGSPAHVINYRLTWSGPSSGSILTGNVLSYTFKNLSAGTYTFTLTALDTTHESAPTGPVSTQVAPSFQTIDTAVYKQSQAINGYSMVKVGEIALGTICDRNHNVDGYSLLPDRTAVTYANKRIILPTSVFAKCALQ